MTVNLALVFLLTGVAPGMCGAIRKGNPTCDGLKAMYQDEFVTSGNLFETAPDLAACQEAAKEIGSFWTADATFVSDTGTIVNGLKDITALWASFCPFIPEVYPGGGLTLQHITNSIDCGVTGETGWLHGEHTVIVSQNGQVLQEFTDYFAHLARFRPSGACPHGTCPKGEGWKFFFSQFTDKADRR